MGTHATHTHTHPVFMRVCEGFKLHTRHTHLHTLSRKIEKKVKKIVFYTRYTHFTHAFEKTTLLIINALSRCVWVCVLCVCKNDVCPTKVGFSAKMRHKCLLYADFMLNLRLYNTYIVVEL